MWSSYDLIIYYLDVLDILGVVGILNPISGTVGMKLTPGPEGMGGGVFCGGVVLPPRPVSVPAGQCWNPQRTKDKRQFPGLAWVRLPGPWLLPLAPTAIVP